MQLKNGEERHQLREILMNAFSTNLSLEKLISDYLNETIDTTGNEHERIILNLMRNYDEADTIELLVRAARKARPKHGKLREFSLQGGFEQAPIPTSPPPTPAVDTSGSPNLDTDTPLKPTEIRTYDVFISYCEEDQPWVQNYLVPSLRNAKLDVLVDYDGFPGYRSIKKNIDQAILYSHKTVAVLSPDYLKSNWSGLEIDAHIALSMNSGTTETLITIVYEKWDYNTIPPTLQRLPWLNFTRSEEKEFTLEKLIASIKGKALPLRQSPTSPAPTSLAPDDTASPTLTPPAPDDTASPTLTPPAPDNTASPTPPTYYVVPLDTHFPPQSLPGGRRLLPGYLYLGQCPDLSGELFYRMQDGHVAVLFPGRNGNFTPFLIDKYAITNQQFCTFLNDLLAQKRASITTLTGREKITSCHDKEGHLLAVDATAYWKERQKAPWGMTYRNTTWQPLAGCASLPATLVSWQGAHMYGLWVHHLLEQITPSSCLPTTKQWRDAAQFDPERSVRLIYPWGNTWQGANAHYKNSPPIGEIRPLPVSSLEKGHSPIGCVQLVGNTWEWCADSPPGQPERHNIKGGACNSPPEHCIPSFEDSTIDATEYIGFRCSLSLLD